MPADIGRAENALACRVHRAGDPYAHGAKIFRAARHLRRRARSPANDFLAGGVFACGDSFFAQDAARFIHGGHDGLCSAHVNADSHG